MFFSFNVYSGVLLPFFVQGVVVAVVLWARRQRQDAAADGWLALLLLLFTARLAQWMLGFAGWYDSHDARTVFMFYFPFSNWLAVGPALYVYFRSLTNQEFRLGRQWVHFVPALVVVAVRLVAAGYDLVVWHGWQGRALPQHFGTKGPLLAWLDWEPLLSLLELVSYLSVLYYAVRTLREYRAYAHYLTNNFSDVEQIRFRWLRNVVSGVVVGTGVALVFMLINEMVRPLDYVQSWYDYLCTGFLIYYLSIAGLLTGHRLSSLRFQPSVKSVGADHPEISAVIQPPVAAGTLPFVEANEETVASEPNAELLRWSHRVRKHMAEAQPYLSPELTLSELAAQLRTNTSWLSRVINTGCGQNFNDFVNEYRVQEAERRLRDPQFRHYTLLAVALEAGFNSKSTFNRVFKKLRGLTPSEVAR